MLALSPDARTAVTQGKGQGGSLLELATGKPRLKLKDVGRVMRFSNDGRHVLVLGGGTSSLLVDLSSGKDLRYFDAASEVGDATFAPNGMQVAGGCADGSVYLWETATGTLSGRLTGHPGGVGKVAYSSDGKHLFSAGADSAVLIWDRDAIRPAPQARGLTDVELAGYWDTLAAEDAARAGEALARIAAAPEAVPFLKTKLQLAAAGQKVKPLEELRSLRAVEVLELHGGAGAKDILGTLVQGDAAAP